MAAVADYVVYMTYDLHGQWDYDNAFSEYVHSYPSEHETDIIF